MATDNLGRNIDAGMGSAELKGLIESLAKGNVGKAKPFKQTASSNTDKILSELKSVAPKFSNSVKKFEGLVDSIKKFISSGGSKKEAKESRIGKNSEAADKAMKKLADKGLKKGSIWTHDMYVEKMQKLMYLEMKKQTAVAQNNLVELASLDAQILTANTELESAEKERGSKGESGGDSRLEQLQKKLEKIGANTELAGLILMGESVEKFSDSIGELQETIMGFRATEVLFKDLYTAERDFTINTRQIAFEIAGATKEARGLQRSFEDIGETTAETGFDRSTTQEAYLKALKKGAKEQKTALSITKNQLNTERMIGVAAGTLEDTFTNMSLQMGMNSSQMAQFGRGIQDVAKNTGVTGEHLANAVRSSEGIMKNMRNAGTLTAQSAANVVGLMASAEKFGVGEFAQQFTDVLSQGMSGFIHADQKMQIILGQALGHNAQLMEQMRNGTIMQTKEGMRGLAEGMEDTLARFSGGRVRTSEDFAKLSDQEKMLLNTRMKEATGRTAVEFLQVTKSLNEAAEPLSKKLEKIAEQKKKNLNAEEKAALIEQERSLKVSAGLSALTQLDEKFKASSGGIEGMQEALASLQTGEMAQELKALGVDTKDAKAMGQATIEQTLKGLNDGLTKLGQSSVDISADRIKALSGDSTEMEKIMGELNAGQQKLATAQKDAADPMTQLRRTMEKLNDTLRGNVQGAVSAMMNSAFGESIGILTTLVDVGGSFAGFAAKSVLEYSIIKSSITQLGKDASMLFGAGGPLAGVFGTGGSLGGAATAIGAAAGPIALAAVAAVAVYGAFSQAAKSAEKAGEIFGKSMEEITTAEYYAAKGAGFMTGALNTLTFGIFDHWIGSTGVVTKALAQFNKMIPIVSIIMGIFDAIFGAIWGVITSIKDVVVGAFEMIYYAVSPIGEIFTLIGNAISDALGPLFNFGSKLSETGTIFQMFAGIFGYFGKVIRNILVTIGKVIGGLVKIIINVLSPVITFVGKAIGGLAAIFGHFFESVYDYFRGLFLFFEGLFSLDFSKMGQGLWNMLTNAFLGLPTLIFNLFKYAFTLIYIEIPKAIMGIPKMIYDAIWGGLKTLAGNEWVGEMFKPFLEIFQPFYEAFNDLYKSLSDLWATLASAFEPIQHLFSELGRIFSEIATALGFTMGEGDLFKTMIQGIAWAIGWVIRVALFPLKLFFQGIAVVLIGVSEVINLVAGAFKTLINWGWKLVEGILYPFNWLYDVLVGHSIVPDLVSDIVMFFATLPFKILKGLASLPFMFIDWVAQMFGMMPGAIGKALYSAASSVGLGWLVDKIMGTSGGVTSPTESLVTASTAATTTATTAPMTTSEDTLQREAGSESTESKDLGTIASASETQVSQMDQMISLLTQILNQGGVSTEPGLIGSLASSFMGGNEVSTMGENVATSPPKYYRWSIGKHNQTAALGVSNLANIG